MLRLESGIKEHLKNTKPGCSSTVYKSYKSLYFLWLVIEEKAVVARESKAFSFIFAHEKKEPWLPAFVDTVKR